MNIKTNFIYKIGNSNKIIKDNIQEFNKLENLIQSKNKILSENEKLFNKINEEMSIIKSDLSGTVEEISKKCLNNDVLIYSIMNKNYNNINNNTTNSKNININEISRDIGDLNNNNNNNLNIISSNVVLVKSPSMNNINQTNNLQNNKIRLNPIINRNNSQSFITDKIHQNDFYNFNNFNSNLKQINDLISENNKEFENKSENINKFKKININNINKSSLYHDDKRRIKEKIKLKNINSFSLDFSHINYNKVDDDVYHKLLDRKKSFLAEKERIAFNIKEIQKTFSSKYNKVNICLKNNIVKLNNLKVVNNSLQEEINQLQKLLKEIENKNKQTEN
jgi:hypothetical protein